MDVIKSYVTCYHRLSSFVIKCFHQAKDYIAVDDKKIAQTLLWLMARQAANGSFAEPPNGRVIHVDMQVRTIMYLFKFTVFLKTA